MKIAAVEVLAQIRLNLSSVDQFLAIACGLGDDNPDIKEEIYLATSEVRSSALLIDHLRNLFNHQQSVEAQREFFGDYSAGNHSDFDQQLQSSSLEKNKLNHQAQQQQDIDIEQIEKNLFKRLEQSHHGRHCRQQQPQQRQDSTNSLLFTYTNQLALVRAAKSLVANVAKILYLTDSILARSGHLLNSDSCFVEEDQQGFGAILEQQKQRQQQQEPQPQQPNYFSTTCKGQVSRLAEAEAQTRSEFSLI